MEFKSDRNTISYSIITTTGLSSSPTFFKAATSAGISVSPALSSNQETTSSEGRMAANSPEAETDTGCKGRIVGYLVIERRNPDGSVRLPVKGIISILFVVIDIRHKTEKDHIFVFHELCRVDSIFLILETLVVRPTVDT